MSPIVLASSSIYRADLLRKMGILFQIVKPHYDEEAAKLQLLQQNTTPLQVAETLSKGKAHSVDFKNSIIIASDQLIQFENKILGKPKHFENAFLQLQQMQGHTHELITAVTILTPTQEWHLNHTTSLKMKCLTDDEIKNYLKKDEPFDCAGSYKIEKHGIILFDEIKTDDFSAIQGLPLIWISKKLKELGYEFFKH